MAYTGPHPRTVELRWAIAPSVKQYARYQDVYKTVPGTERSDAPYFNDESFILESNQIGGGATITPDDCKSSSNQSIYGRNYNDYYALQGRADTKARSRFLTAMKEQESASIGAAAAQWDKTLGMMTQRASQILRIAKAVKRLDVRALKRALVGSPPIGKIDRAKDWSSVFLEYAFGWAPLVSDIYAGAEILSNPYPSNGRTRSFSMQVHDSGLVTTFQSTSIRRRIQARFHALTSLRGEGTLVNPNLGLLEQLGLVNPATVAWEIVPFSFVIDYFVDVGGYLNSLTDTVGWEFRNLTTTRYRYVDNGVQWQDRSADNGNTWPRTRIHGGVHAYMLQRTVGGAQLPRWSSSVDNPLNGLSLQRAATSIALLTQFLKS